MTEFDRNAGMGASDVAAALGLDPYVSPTDLYLEKIGQGPARAERDVMVIGKLLEEPVARLYARHTGHRVQRHRRACAQCTRAGREAWCTQAAIFDAEYPWLFAHLDRVAWDPETKPARRYVLEIKTTSRPGDEWGESGTDQVPLRVLVQSMIQMRLSGYHSAVVAAFVWGRDLRTYRLAHDPGLEQRVLAQVLAFRQAVADRIPPVHPAHRETAAALRRLYATDNGLQMVVDDADWGLVDRVVDAYAYRREAEARYRTVQAEAMARLGDLAGLQWDGGSITWKTQQHRAVDWQRVAEWAGERAGLRGSSEWTDLVDGHTATDTRRVFRVSVKGAPDGE